MLITGLDSVRFQIVDMDSDIFQDNGYDGVEEYEEELTAAEVLQKLEDAWLNEKHSPELLDPKMEIVECMLEQVLKVTFLHWCLLQALARSTI